MKLRLNLATSPQANNRPFLLAATLAGAVGLVALFLLSRAAYVSWQAQSELRLQTARWETQIRGDQLQYQQLEAYFRGPAAKQVLDRSAFLNSLIDARSFPWTRIFMDLEQTLPPGVRVVSISPRLKNGRAEVELEVGASSDESKIEFLKAMETSRMFSGLIVKGERQPQQPGAGDKIVLDLTVWYSTT